MFNTLLGQWKRLIIKPKSWSCRLRLQKVNKIQKSGDMHAYGSKEPNLCFRCGREGHYARDKCYPAKSATCRKYQNVGNSAAVCKSKVNTCTDWYEIRKPKR